MLAESRRFAGNAPEDTAALWAVGGAKDKIVVISDIHLGIEDKYTETLENKPLLIEFLQRLQNTTDPSKTSSVADPVDDSTEPKFSEITLDLGE